MAKKILPKSLKFKPKDLVLMTRETFGTPVLGTVVVGHPKDPENLYTIGLRNGSLIEYARETQLTMYTPKSEFIRLTNCGVTLEQTYPIDIRPNHIRAKFRGPNNWTTVIVESGPAGTFKVVETPDEIDRLIALKDPELF